MFSQGTEYIWFDLGEPINQLQSGDRLIPDSLSRCIAKSSSVSF